MSDVLLDSHVVLWLLDGDARARDIASRLVRGADAASVSAVSVYEIEVKRRAGRLVAPPDLVGALSSLPVALVDVDANDAAMAAGLPPIHRDPWDRLIVAQAIRRDLILVTADRVVKRYGVASRPPGPLGRRPRRDSNAGPSA